MVVHYLPINQSFLSVYLTDLVVFESNWSKNKRNKE